MTIFTIKEIRVPKARNRKKKKKEMAGAGGLPVFFSSDLVVW